MASAVQPFPGCTCNPCSAICLSNSPHRLIICSDGVVCLPEYIVITGVSDVLQDADPLELRDRPYYCRLAAEIMPTLAERGFAVLLVLAWVGGDPIARLPNAAPFRACLRAPLIPLAIPPSWDHRLFDARDQDAWGACSVAMPTPEPDARLS